MFQDIHPFHLLAYVILPDHFHWVMQVPEDRPNFSIVIHSLKRNFSINLKKSYGMNQSVHLWQDRFWDHIIRNEGDLERHFDYIHWNPVKHEYVYNPEDWKESTLAHWMSKRYYPASWGSEDEPKNLQDFIVAE